MAALPGSGLPDSYHGDGLSVAPTLLGLPGQTQHEYLYWELGDWQAVRLGQWKGVLPKSGKELELYDLATDVSESKNVAGNIPTWSRGSRKSCEPRTYLRRSGPARRIPRNQRRRPHRPPA